MKRNAPHHRRNTGRLLAAALIGSVAWTHAGCSGPPQPEVRAPLSSSAYGDLVDLFEDWRAFERPPLLDGAPDYTAERMAAAHVELETYFDRLNAIDATSWLVKQQVDWHIVRAELNGFDFNCRVLQPWARDPAFYQSVWTYKSDVPAHEGPAHHALLELWTYEFPLTPSEETRLIGDLRVIPPLLDQAKRNLTGNARELFVAGIHNIQTQVTDLESIRERAEGTASDGLLTALDAAQAATRGMVRRLEAEAPSKTGPSGIGKDNYTWYLQHVHLVPMTWEDEVRLLTRELERAWSSLRLEEARNGGLPDLVAADSPAEYDRKADQAASQMMAFLAEKDVMRVKANMEPALREHLGSFIPEEKRNFFWITAHYDPAPLYSHFYHWWDHAHIRDEPHPSPIRREALLYNIFDSRCEGVATGVEEMFMQAGLHDRNPRAREIVWILLAQRAARGLGSLYAHANEMTMEDAGKVHVKWTPRGWMSTEPELLKFEQHLYLRQPGYGTSYITGKYLFERLLADCHQAADERGESLRLSDFFEELNQVGCVPFSLIRWQMTGLRDAIPSTALTSRARPSGSAQ